ncbi:riboflavin kinase isoform X2 [Planococcus citri]
MSNGLPLFLEGKVCKGFGRGSKELGCPTANFDDNVEKLLPKEIISGVYFGWAQVEEGPVYKMVMSIGWNPFYKNVKRSIETHILHEFPQDFYDSTLKVVILDYIRPELNFTSKDELMKQINDDIAEANQKLDESRYSTYHNHEFFNLSLSNREEKDGPKDSVNGVQAKI